MQNNNDIEHILPVGQLYGLVVCGGKSNRMGTDKSLLHYHVKAQRYHLYDMLKGVCEKVFISCNATQAEDIADSYEILIDMATCKSIGPMAAIVTAIIHYPQNDFLVVGCDYPFLTIDELYSFVFLNRDETSSAFYNDTEQLYEPLLGCYHHSGHHRLMKMYATGQYSLQHFLKNEAATKYYPKNKNACKSIDTKHEYLKAKKLIDRMPQWK